MTAGSGPPAPALPPPFRLVAEDRIDSTNAAARRMAGADAPHGTVVWALEQTGGRGRRGRGWRSPRGNLYASVLLRPRTDLRAAGQLGFAAALGLAEVVAGVLPAGRAVALKWPNDVLIGERKVAGILLESVADAAGRPAGVVLGMGLNIAEAPGETAFPATSLVAEGAPAALAPGDVLAEVVPRLGAYFDAWEREGFAPLREAWLRRARGVGAPVTVRLPDRTLAGTFLDLDPDGALVLRRDSGMEQRIHVGDVFFGGR